MPDLDGRFLLDMQRSFLVGVLGQLDAHDLVAPGAGARSFVHRHLGGALGLVGLALVLGPVELEGVVLQLPTGAGAILDDALELPLGVGWLRHPGIDIGLLHVLKGRLSIGEQRAIPVIIAKMMGLRAGHPFRHILTILPEWIARYVEEMRYLRRCTATSEL